MIAKINYISKLFCISLSFGGKPKVSLATTTDQGSVCSGSPGTTAWGLLVFLPSMRLFVSGLGSESSLPEGWCAWGRPVCHRATPRVPSWECESWIRPSLPTSSTRTLASLKEEWDMIPAISLDSGFWTWFKEMILNANWSVILGEKQ